MKKFESECCQSDSLINPFTSTLESAWQSPRFVWINDEVVHRTAQELAVESFEVPAWREEVFPVDDREFLDFIGVGNAINFAFTDFKTFESFSVHYRGTLWRGAFAMWACLRRALESGVNVLSGEYLRDLALEDVGQIFDGETGIPMLQERWRILREVGERLDEQYGGSFHRFFAAGQSRAYGPEGLVDRLIASFPSFRDEAVDRATGATLRFQKRAQLMAMMYQGRALNSDSLPRLSDWIRVGPIADYTVPRALHGRGILQYAPELERRIVARKLIEKDSLEELEIRSQTVHAQIVLLSAINELRSSPISFVELDYKLWTMGRGVKSPHHLTITTAY